MDKIDKLLYFGSLYDFYPVYTFQHIKEFVYVDTFPRGPWDETDRFNKKYYDNDFLTELKHKCYLLEFKLIDDIDLDETYKEKILTPQQKLYYYLFSLPKNINPRLLIFYCHETDQTIKYYISTNILYNMNATLLKDIEESNALLVSYFIPSIKLLDYFDKDKPKIFLGYTDNKYTISKNKEKDIKITNNLIEYLHKNDDNNYFINYISISKNTEKITIHKTITTMSKFCLQNKYKYLFLDDYM
jgi:hypothetical protein